MKKMLITTTVLAAAIFLTACSQQRNATSKKTQVVASPVATAVVAVKTPIAYSCSKNETALSALQKANHTVEIKQYSFGKVVTSIDGQVQGNNKYWSFAVNGKDAAVGAEAYKCKGTENISWELK